MPNTLIKDPLPTGSGGGGGGGGGSGSGGGGGTLPPEGSPCFSAIAARIHELWPAHTVEYIKDKGLFRVESYGGGYVYHVTGSCSGGYVTLNYETVRAPGVGTG